MLAFLTMSSVPIPPVYDTILLICIEKYIFLSSFHPGMGLGTTGKQSGGLILPPSLTNYTLGNSNDLLVGLLFSEKTVKNRSFK